MYMCIYFQAIAKEKGLLIILGNEHQNLDQKMQSLKTQELDLITQGK